MDFFAGSAAHDLKVSEGSLVVRAGRFSSIRDGSRPRLRAVGAILVALACLGGLSPRLRAGGLEDDASGKSSSASAAPKDGAVRAVRLSSVDGQVRVVQDGQIIADPATANLPLFEGSQIMTGDEGRAEIQLENGNVARLSPNSTLTLTVLQRVGAGTKTDMVLNSGLAYFELQPTTAQNSVRVSYGPATFTASSFTVVRLTLDEAPGELAVFSGNIHLERGDALQVDVHGGESLTLGVNDATRYDVGETIEPNSWDSWNADRDQLLNSESARKTAATTGISQTPGMSDLDANGNWYNVPGQGYVWSPYEAEGAGADFDPYGYGSWVSYPGYGYLFASGYGWGYAPYQCGLWNYYDSFGWGWAPGSSGCYPWYGYSGYGGGSGYGFNLGNRPRGYRPPRKPGPVHPKPLNGNQGGKQLAIVPVVPVDRRPAGGTSAGNGRGGEPITIAGQVVTPLAPLAPRQTYGGSSGGFVSGTARPGSVGTAGGTRAGSGYYPLPSGGRSGDQSYHPAGGVVNRPSSAPQPSRPSSGGGNSGGAARSTASAPSGGGGGGSHASSGGGSGGGGSSGGGSHK